MLLRAADASDMCCGLGRAHDLAREFSLKAIPVGMMFSVTRARAGQADRRSVATAGGFDDPAGRIGHHSDANGQPAPGAARRVAWALAPMRPRWAGSMGQVGQYLAG
jgi:hypothetical protein